MTGTSSKWTSTRLVRTFSSPRHADASLDLQGIAVRAGDVRLIAAPGAPLLGACLSATHRCIMLHVARRGQRGCLPGIRRLRLAHTRLARREVATTGTCAFDHLDIWLSAAIWGVSSTRHSPVATWRSPLPRV